VNMDMGCRQHYPPWWPAVVVGLRLTQHPVRTPVVSLQAWLTACVSFLHGMSYFSLLVGAGVKGPKATLGLGASRLGHLRGVDSPFIPLLSQQL
jgi:hypothetical protein